MIAALSIRQPWAWLIVNGHKDIENRDWPTKFRGRMLVHAGQTMARSYYEDTLAALRDAGLCPPVMPAYEALERGGIVGEVCVTDCVQEHRSRWKQPESAYGFVLAHGKTLPFLRWKGQLGFFNVPKSQVWPGEFRP